MKSLPMTSGFSIERFKQVTRRLLVINKKRYALGIGGALIGLYAFWLLIGIFNVQSSLRETSAAILAFGVLVYQIGGYVLTASIFSELQSQGSASQFLTLPATTGEKLLSGWVITYLLYTIAALLGFSLLLLVMTLTGTLLFSTTLGNIFDFSEIYLNNVILTYLIFNSVFLLGSAFFKGNNFLKTAFSILLFFAFSGIFFISILNLFGPDSFRFVFSSQDIFKSDGAFLNLLVQLLYTVPITALFLTFSYFRLKNRQVA